jgi:CheY-like chemotaxis protein
MPIMEAAIAVTGAETLRLVRECRFDLVILDVMLPDTDGFTIVRRLQGRAPQRSVDSPLLRVPAALDTYYIEMWSNGRPVTPLVGGNDNLIPAFGGAIPVGAHTATSANGQTQLRVLAEPVGSLGTLVVTTSLTSLDSTARAAYQSRPGRRRNLTDPPLIGTDGCLSGLT